MTDTHIVPFGPTGNPNGPVTMSSREIAEICGKRHAHVIRDIENMLTEINEPKFGSVDFEAKYQDAKGEWRKEYRLPKDLVATLITGYRADLRYRVIKRLEEYETGRAGPQFVLDPSDPKVMLACFNYLQKQVAEKDAIIETQSKQVKKLERLEGAEGSMCISDAAKTLGVGRNDLFRFMESRRWIFKRPGNRSWLAYDDKRKSGYMDHDDHIYIDSQERERVSTRALVTAKGLVKLAELLNAPLH